MDQSEITFVCLLYSKANAVAYRSQKSDTLLNFSFIVI